MNYNKDGFLKKVVSKIDVMGKPINLSYKSSSRIQTIFGGILTSLIYAFSVYSIIYFGSDIVQKKNPTTRYGRFFNGTDPIKMQNIPFVVSVTNANFGSISEP